MSSIDIISPYVWQILKEKHPKDIQTLFWLIILFLDERIQDLEKKKWWQFWK